MEEGSRLLALGPARRGEERLFWAEQFAEGQRMSAYELADITGLIKKKKKNGGAATLSSDTQERLLSGEEVWGCGWRSSQCGWIPVSLRDPATCGGCQDQPSNMYVCVKARCILAEQTGEQRGWGLNNITDIYVNSEAKNAKSWPRCEMSHGFIDSDIYVGRMDNCRLLIVSSARFKVKRGQN